MSPKVTTINSKTAMEAIKSEEEYKDSPINDSQTEGAKLRNIKGGKDD